MWIYFLLKKSTYSVFLLPQDGILCIFLAPELVHGILGYDHYAHSATGFVSKEMTLHAWSSTFLAYLGFMACRISYCKPIYIYYIYTAEYIYTCTKYGIFSVSVCMATYLYTKTLYVYIGHLYSPYA